MNISLMGKLRLKKALKYSTLLILLAFFAGAIATNFFGKLMGVQAAAFKMCSGTPPVSIIKQGDATYDNKNITIPATYSGTGDTGLDGTPCIAAIDGEHTFTAVTVQNGGTLTSNDYNKYGVYPRNDTSSNFANILDPDDQRYAFIMRGFINTGNVHNRVYAIADGEYGYEVAFPSRWNVDDAAIIEFYPAVAAQAVGQEATYNESFWSGAPVGSSYSNVHLTQVWASLNNPDPLNPQLTLYTDNQSSAAKPLIPFEFKYYNAGGATKFGISSCTGATNSPGAACDVIQNYSYLDTVSQGSAFSAAPSRPEMKTFVAWQGANQTMTDDLNSADSTNSNLAKWRKRSTFNDTINTYKVDLDWNPDFFYKTTANYDFRSDRKVEGRVTAEGTLNLFRTLTDVDQHETNYNTPAVGQLRPKAHFRPEQGTDRISPLAMRRDIYNRDTTALYPTISESLVAVLPRKLPTIINIPDGTFTVASGGKVNFNGKGYSTGGGTIGGGGPGGGRVITATNGTVMTVGASHSGSGGVRWPAPFDSRYDSSLLVEPTQPGSGGYWPTDFNNTWRLGYGGGMIKVAAKTITLQSRSMVMANGINFQTDHGSPGGSGGTIIFQDSDSNSTYDGVIAAQGGSCFDNINPDCRLGAGGGGYVSINTSSATDTLYGRYWADKDKYFWGSYGGNVAQNPSVENYVGFGGFLANTITASGGRNEDEEVTHSSWGKYGIVKISGSSPAGARSFSIQKTLEPFKRDNLQYNPTSGANYFNPYALRPGDTIKVTLHVRDVDQGVKITDQVLKQASKSSGYWYCKPEVDAGTQNVTLPSSLGDVGVFDSSASPPEVKWTASSGADEAYFYYYCKVSK